MKSTVPRLAASILAIGIAAGQQYSLSIIAGGSPLDGPLPATKAPLGDIEHVAVDSAGNLFLSSSTLNSVFKVNPAGVLTRVAGTGLGGFSGDGGPAASARLKRPLGLALDSSGNLYIADNGNGRVRKVDSKGTISTVIAPFPDDPYAGYPMALAFDRSGNLYVAYSTDSAVMRLQPDGQISWPYRPQTGAGFSWVDIAVDSSGNLYVFGLYTVQRVTPSGSVTTVAGNGLWGPSPDGGLAASSSLDLPRALAFDQAGNLLLADGDRIRRIDAKGIISTVAGAAEGGFAGDGGLASAALFNTPAALAFDSAGNLFVADWGNHRVRRISTDLKVTTWAGDGTWAYSGDGGPATSAQINPTATVMDSAGNLYFSDQANYVVRKISPAGIITTVAGNGTQGYSGDGGKATSAQLSNPQGLAVDASGNLFIAEVGDEIVPGMSPPRIREVTAGGTILTIARLPEPGANATGGPSLSFAVSFLFPVAVDSTGGVVFADSSRIWTVSSAGALSVLAGGDTAGYSGDGGPASQAQINSPGGLAFDRMGNLYVADSGNGLLRKIDTGGVITTVAGGGFDDFESGIPASRLSLAWITGVAIDPAGNTYCSAGNLNFARIFKITANGMSFLVASSKAEPSDLAETGTATSQDFLQPLSLTADAKGNIYTTSSGALGGAGLLMRLAVPQIPLLNVSVDAEGQSPDLTIEVNNGAATIATHGTVTVSVSMSVGAGIDSISGSGWTCGSNNCQRSDSLPAGATFPPIHARVRASGGFQSSATPQSGRPNQVFEVTAEVAGGGSPTFTANESIVIVPSR